MSSVDEQQKLKKLLLVLCLAAIVSILYFVLRDHFSKNVDPSQFPVQPSAQKNKASSRIQVKSGDIKETVLNGKKYLDLSWKDLVQLDYESGEKKGNLKEFENKLVKIPGYIVPLTDEYTVLEEFLFVPNDQACIHVPPPPPNLIIKSKLAKKLPFEKVHNPSWLLGVLEIVTTESTYGNAGYRIEEAQLIKYEFED